MIVKNVNIGEHKVINKQLFCQPGGAVTEYVEESKCTEGRQDWTSSRHRRERISRKTGV